MSWTSGPMLGFDTETTGIDVETERIVSASFVNVTSSAERNEETVYINPGIPIPEVASKIHGITNEFIAAHGEEPAQAIEGIVTLLAAVLSTHDHPLVGHNIVYDLTILDREARRHGVVPLYERVEVWPVIDTLVLDKAVDRFRKGTGMRKLEALQGIYRIPPVGDAHTSAADAYMSLGVAWRIGRLYPAVGALSLQQLHDWQVLLKVDQDKSMASWLKGQQRDFSDCTGEWPFRLPADLPRAQAPGELVDVGLW